MVTTPATHSDSDGHSGSPETLPYEEITEPSYAETAARSFTVERAKAGVALMHGICPRCGAHITSPLVAFLYRDSLVGRDKARSGQETSDDGVYHVVFCTCDHPHPNRPVERVGCGAYWSFLL